MFDSEKNITTAQQPEIQAKEQPFFSKEGQGDFFSKTNNVNSSFFSPTTIQPKLTVGQPNDKYEVEADAMADKVVQRLSDSSEVNNSPLEGDTATAVGESKHSGGVIQRKCSSCEDEEKLQKKENEFDGAAQGVQRKPIFESNGEQSDIDIQTKLSATTSIQAKCASCA